MDYDGDGLGAVPCCAAPVGGTGDNNLEKVLTNMLRSMAEEEGVEYGD